MGKHSNTTSLTGKYRKKPSTSASSSSARMKTLNRMNKNDNQHRQDNNNKELLSPAAEPLHLLLPTPLPLPPVI